MLTWRVVLHISNLHRSFVCCHMLQRYSHQIVDVQKGFACPTDLEIVIDDVSDLSSFQKSVFLLSFLFLHFDSPFEVRNCLRAPAVVTWRTSKSAICRPNIDVDVLFFHTSGWIYFIDPRHIFGGITWTGANFTLEVHLPRNERIGIWNSIFSASNSVWRPVTIGHKDRTSIQIRRCVSWYQSYSRGLATVDGLAQDLLSQFWTEALFLLCPRFLWTFLQLLVMKI